MDLTALTLFGRARYQVLACLLRLRGADAIHLREIARRAGLSATATQYELRLLARAGLVLQELLSGRALYRINRRHPIARELRSIILKTDADRREGAVKDDRVWARKRAQQRSDYASRTLRRKSPFLAKTRLVSSMEVDLGGESDA